MSGGKFNVELMGNVNNDRLLELKFSRRWQTNKIESDWSNSPRHSSSRQFRSPRETVRPEVATSALVPIVQQHSVGC